jgi:HK97 family phage major capsid protein
MAENATTHPELLADAVAQLLVQPLEAASVVLSSGPRIFDTSGVLRVPRLTSSSPVGYVGESAEIPSDHSTEFDEVVLMPTDRKSLKVIERYSRELVRQSVVGIDSVLKNRLVKVVGDKLDSELLTGTGASKGITGLVNQAGVQTGALDVTNADSLLDAIGLASAAEVTPNRWFINGADFIALRKLKDGEDRYLIESDVTRDTTYRLFGHPVTVTNKLSEGTAVLADVTQVAVARDLAPSVTVLTERYAEFDQVGIRVVTRYDLGLLHPEAVIVLTSDTGGTP